MNVLAGVDFEKLRVGTEGFLGQAIALGVKYGRLSEHTPDALLAYLRDGGTRFGLRYRTGIAVSRDVLERGVRQALVCLELGLIVAAKEDLNRAVELLAEADFEKIRKRGWEEAYARMDEMGRVCRSIPGRPEAHFLRDYGWHIDRWSRVIPETWTVSGGEDNDDNPLDPLHDYLKFRELHARLSFIRLLPLRALRPFAEAVNDYGFGNFLRHLVLVLALDLETLVPNTRDIAAFESDCLGPEGMAAWARDKVTTKAKEMARRAVDDSGLRMLLIQEVEAEIASFEGLSDDSLSDIFVTDS
jgi:hypothetical protein